MAKTIFVANGVVVNGPRTIAPSSIFFRFKTTAPPTFSARMSCGSPVYPLCRLICLTTIPGMLYWVIVPLAKPADTASGFLTSFRPRATNSCPAPPKSALRIADFAGGVER